MAQRQLHGLRDIEARLDELVDPKGPVRIMVSTGSGLPVLDTRGLRNIPEAAAEAAARAAELGRRLFGTARDFRGESPRRAEIHYEGERWLVLHDAPFYLLAGFPDGDRPVPGEKLEQEFATLLRALQEELT